MTSQRWGQQLPIGLLQKVQHLEGVLRQKNTVANILGVTRSSSAARLPLFLYAGSAVATNAKYTLIQMEIGTSPATGYVTARIIYATPATLTGEIREGIKISMLRVASTHAAASASDEGASFSRLSVSALEVEA